MLNIIFQASPGTQSLIGPLIPMILIFIIFYVLLIMPQQRRVREHRAKLEAIQRGDVVVTGGGLIGKVTKIADDELTIDLGEGQKVKAVRAMIADVRSRTEPANDHAGKK